MSGFSSSADVLLDPAAFPLLICPMDILISSIVRGVTFVERRVGAASMSGGSSGKVGAGTNANLALAKSEKIKTMKPVRDREYTVHFAADTHSLMKWNFKPSQKALRIVPGETALAFYTAENPTDKPIVGIATYSVVPFEASKYFHKIQTSHFSTSSTKSYCQQIIFGMKAAGTKSCFCFEEQRLNPHEKVSVHYRFTRKVFYIYEINQSPCI
ncbi:unnamed protein product [Schistosoma mattheei]|uniref:Uncharacterized protein n=1 Tax=Schistosoma mattheei TaxID=31246 RepID=A0A183P4E3_9TREM|nr:unnamed protein product [Schistosoma mattheei]